jgi:hypothetical protein
MENLPLDKYSMNELQLIKKLLHDMEDKFFPDKLVAGIIKIVLSNKDYQEYYSEQH